MTVLDIQTSLLDNSMQLTWQQELEMMSYQTHMNL